MKLKAYEMMKKQLETMKKRREMIKKQLNMIKRRQGMLKKLRIWILFYCKSLLWLYVVKLGIMDYVNLGSLKGFNMRDISVNLIQQQIKYYK